MKQRHSSRSSPCTAGCGLRRRPWALALTALTTLTVLSACHTEGTTTQISLGTVGSVDLPPATTLRPAVENTEVTTDITSSLPPGVLFTGDPCSALSATDFAQVGIDGAPPGELVDAQLLSPDTCGYSILSGRRAFVVEVAARSPQDFAQPEQYASGAVEPVAGIGLEAVAFARPDGTQVVMVRVDNGYFWVRSSDAESAADFAARAVDNA